ncbi:hypothetical protein AB0436_13545 [Streptomyces sp. NPDC051322]|uniref:hypothetical protein n=1 Tax=Streptomyces sp. NPDC051322 TaxID=3154645 RepID=UPI00344E54CB
MRRDISGGIPPNFSGIDPKALQGTITSLKKDTEDLRGKIHGWKSKFERLAIETKDLTGVLNICTWSDDQLLMLERRRRMAIEMDEPYSGHKHMLTVDENKLDSTTMAQTKKDAREALALAKKGAKLDRDELSTLQLMFSMHKGDPYFAEKVATGLGSNGSLRFWAAINDAHQGNQPATVASFLKELQKDFSATLATASYSNSPAMREWKSQIIDHGDKQFITDPTKETTGPFGFQLMSSLMRTGNYDSRFLDQYGNKLIGFEKHTSPANLWNSGGMLHEDLNFAGGQNDQGVDPMTGFLDALGNNHAASTRFFHDKEHFNYLVGKGDNVRVWPQDNGKFAPRANQTQHFPGFDALGKALESATTGHNFGSDPLSAATIHTPEQASLMHDIVVAISKEPDLVRPGMADNLGRISAEYMPDIHRIIDSTTDSEIRENMFPIEGASASLDDQHDVIRFLHTLGRNPDGYAAINLGQRNYTANLLHYHLDHPEVFLDGQSGSHAERVNKLVGYLSQDAGEIQGIIGHGREWEVEHTSDEKDEKYNKALGVAAGWADKLVGVGVGYVTSPLEGVRGGEFAGGQIGGSASGVVGGIFDNLKHDNHNEVIFQTGAEWQKIADSVKAATGNTLDHVLAREGLNRTDLRNVADHAIEAGLNDSDRDIGRAFEGESYAVLPASD